MCSNLLLLVWHQSFQNIVVKKILMIIRVVQTNFPQLILALALFSLAGIPPTAGFFGKLFLLTAGGASCLLVHCCIEHDHFALLLSSCCETCSGG
jgi:hypothetical protein